MAASIKVIFFCDATPCNPCDCPVGGGFGLILCDTDGACRKHGGVRTLKHFYLKA